MIVSSCGITDLAEQIWSVCAFSFSFAHNHYLLVLDKIGCCALVMAISTTYVGIRLNTYTEYIFLGCRN